VHEAQAAFLLIAAVCGIALRSRVRRFESCWGRINRTSIRLLESQPISLTCIFAIRQSAPLPIRSPFGYGRCHQRSSYNDESNGPKGRCCPRMAPELCLARKQDDDWGAPAARVWEEREEGEPVKPSV